MKIMVTSLKRSQACTATAHVPNPAAGNHRPMPSPETPGHPQTSLQWWLLFLSPWVLVHKVLLCPPRVYSPVLYKSLQLCSGVDGDLLQVDLCHTNTQSPCPCSRPLQTSTGAPPQEMLKHNSVSVCVGSLDPGGHKVCLSPLSISGRNGVWSWTRIHPPTLLLRLSFALGQGVSHSFSSAYRLTEIFLTLDLGYLLSAAGCSSAMQPGVNALLHGILCGRMGNVWVGQHFIYRSASFLYFQLISYSHPEVFVKRLPNSISSSFPPNVF